MSGELAPGDFDTYFEAVHGHEPYPWQSRLTSEVLESGRWPSVVDLPTGTGKTAVLDTAVFALALRPEMFPRRIVFVIDRRIVVDQVYERARLIRDGLSEAKDGVLAVVGSRLRDRTGDGEPLGIAALRGGVPLDSEWFRRPDQPAVIVSTVDQFGSRLLFRGYGVSPGMRPVHAGLVGNDCLVILDEVHLSRAFERTLRDASSDGDIPLLCSVNPDSSLPRRYSIVEMSATPRDDSAQTFTLAPGDLDASAALRRIAHAPKRAKLVEVGGTRPPHESVPKKVTELLERELHDDEKSVGVIVNRVRTARETHAALVQAKVTAHLVTGRMRPIDKQAAYADIEKLVDPDRPAPSDERTVVVATQAIEVGADFSFDALITEAAPIDSLQQRFGRLDRRGKRAVGGDPARCWILGVASALKKLDPVYSNASKAAWEELVRLAEDDELEVGPAENLVKRLSDDARAPNADAPLLLPTHVDAWSQTQPVPIADPDIAEFLHGKEQQREPEVSIAWRRDRSEAALNLVPPRSVEFLSVPISAAKSWLSGDAETQVSDVSSTSDDTQPAKGQRGRGSIDGALADVVRRVRRSDQSDQRWEALQHPHELKPGDLIVVDPMRGGLCNGTWDPSYRPSQRNGDEPHRPPVEDCGDEAQLISGEGVDGPIDHSRVTLRLDEHLKEFLTGLRAKPEGSELPEMPSPDRERDSEISREEEFEKWLEGLKALPEGCLDDWMRTVVEHFVNDRPDIELVDDQYDADTEGRYWVLVGRRVDPALMDESDHSNSLTGSAATLREHLAGVACKVSEYGRRLGLGDELVDDLRLAAELHDLGKIDERFQRQLHGGDLVSVASSPEPLAKSRPGTRTTPGQWPRVRHEVTSVALAESNPVLLERAHDPDLVLHLIGSHHGHTRPFPSMRNDDSPRMLELAGELGDEGFRLLADRDTAALASSPLIMCTDSNLAETPLALEMADRFWRLQERYGHHGLAWLESILRLADQQRSKEEAES